MYRNAVTASLGTLRSREAQTDVHVSDFIEANFAETRLFHIMNHPASMLVAELAMRLLHRIGERRRPTPPAVLLGDTELLSVWHPENPYVRQSARLRFPGHRVYRGVRLVPAQNSVGVAPSGPCLYSPEEMVEAVFSFYEPHRAVIAEHPRVRSILDRQTKSA